MAGAVVMLPSGRDTARRVGGRAGVAQGRRRHLDMRKIVAVVVLASFLAPGMAAVIATVL